MNRLKKLFCKHDWINYKILPWKDCKKCYKTKFKKIMKTVEQVKKEINDKLEENGLLIPAVGLAEHFVKTYNDEDWEAYEKETGNPRLDFVPPKNGLEAMIDEATGYNKEQTLAAGLFLLWNILEFEKGFKEGYEK